MSKGLELGQLCAASACCYTIDMWTSPREAKGTKSIDTKVLAVELKQFIVIYSRKSVGHTQH